MGAPIREELVLADSFSQTFRNFDAAANAAINVAETFQQTLNEFSEGFLDGLVSSLNDSRQKLESMANAATEAAEEQEKITRAVSDTDDEIRKADESERQFANSIRDSERAAGSLMGTISKIAGAIGVVKLAENFIDTSDEMSQIVAKLNMINDGTQTTAQLQEAIYESAQRSRGSYLDTANLVARLGMNAKDTFGSNSEMLQFAENLNKSFTIAGASAQEQASVILQMSQALGSGVLRGQEFNAVMSGAPIIMQNIAEYLGVGVGQLRDMAAEGQITANIVKNAMLGATTQINKQFETIPKTFDSIMTTTENRLIEGMSEVFNEWSRTLESSDMQDAIDGATEGLLELSRVGGTVLTDIAKGVAMINENWEQIEPILAAATTALIAYKVLNMDIAAAVQGAWAAVNKELALVSIAVGALAGVSTYMENEKQPSSFEYLHTLGGDTSIYRTKTGMPFGLGANNYLSLMPGELNALGYAKKWGNDTVRLFLENSFGFDMVNNEWINKVGYTYDEYLRQVTAQEAQWREKGKWYQEYYTRDTSTNYAEQREAWADKALWYERYYGTGVRLVEGEHIAQDSDWYAQTYGYGNKIEESVEEIKDNGVKVKGEVKLSDEDLKIFRDIAENRYIANVSLETLAPSVSVNVENNGQNLSEDDIASAVTKALETQISEHTAISHG